MPGVDHLLTCELQHLWKSPFLSLAGPPRRELREDSLDVGVGLFPCCVSF